MTAGKVFVTVLNMSMTGSAVIAAVALARLALKRTPRWISYALWFVVLFNLLCPLKLESSLSLNPLKPSPIPPDIALQDQPDIDTGISVVNNAVSAFLPSAATPDTSPAGILPWTEAGARVWLAGAGAMLAYAFASYGLLRRKLRFATKTEDGAYETDRIRSPFVLGFVRPRIYIPAGIARGDLTYVMRHERTHIRRRDHLVKPLAYLALAAHWFNPLVWLAYFLLSADMEMSCDERVLKELGGGSRAGYSGALLALSSGRRIVGACPLAFGEGGVKERVKNVLNFRKRSRAAIIAAVAVLAVVSVGFALSRENRSARMWDSASSHTVKWTEDGMQFAWEHSGNIPPVAVSTVHHVPSAHFEDRAGLDTYITAGENLFGSGNDFRNGFSQYGEAYFTNNSLTLIYVEDGVSGVDYSIADVAADGNGTAQIILTRRWPEAGDAVMTARFIAVEHSKAATGTVKEFTACIPAPLSQLPADYGTYMNREQAIADGVFVNVHYNEFYNQIVVDNFYDNVRRGAPAFMRTVMFTIEGDPIITDYSFDAGVFTVICDRSRDKFGGSDRHDLVTKTYKYLVPGGYEGGYPLCWLSNEEEIRTGNGNDLIDGLWGIPSPSVNGGL